MKKKSFIDLEQSLLHSLNKKGWWRSPEKVSKRNTEKLVKRLGVPFDLTEVEVVTKDFPLLLTDKALQFHTDSARAKYILWSCKFQSKSPFGSTLLLDCDQVLEYFTKEEINVLRKIVVLEPTRGENITVPLMKTTKLKYKVYYAPWLTHSSRNKKYAKILAKLDYVIETRLRKKATRIRLIPGEILVINNKRILHARDTLPKKTKRLLLRYWIC